MESPEIHVAVLIVAKIYVVPPNGRARLKLPGPIWVAPIRILTNRKYFQSWTKLVKSAL